MFLSKLIFLLASSVFHLNPGDRQWVILPLAESYEYQVLNGERAMSLEEHHRSFQEQGLEVEHWEIQRDILVFKNEDELKQWIRVEMAPGLSAEDDKNFIELYLEGMQKLGWLHLEEGKIAFPRQQLKVLLFKPSFP
jgi:hypothetical protein